LKRYCRIENGVVKISRGK